MYTPENILEKCFMPINPCTTNFKIQTEPISCLHLYSKQNTVTHHYVIENKEIFYTEYTTVTYLWVLPIASITFDGVVSTVLVISASCSIVVGILCLISVFSVISMVGDCIEVASVASLLSSSL